MAGTSRLIRKYAQALYTRPYPDHPYVTDPCIHFGHLFRNDELKTRLKLRGKPPLTEEEYKDLDTGWKALNEFLRTKRHLIMDEILRAELHEHRVAVDSTVLKLLSLPNAIHQRTLQLYGNQVETGELPSSDTDRQLAASAIDEVECVDQLLHHGYQRLIGPYLARPGVVEAGFNHNPYDTESRIEVSQSKPLSKELCGNSLANYLTVFGTRVFTPKMESPLQYLQIGKYYWQERSAALAQSVVFHEPRVLTLFAACRTEAEALAEIDWVRSSPDSLLSTRLTQGPIPSDQLLDAESLAYVDPSNGGRTRLSYFDTFVSKRIRMYFAGDHGTRGSGASDQYAHLVFASVHLSD